MNIITGIEVSRQGSFTCPVRTLMLFGSNSRIEVSENSILDSFDDVNDESKLKYLLNTRELRLADTNVPSLAQHSSHLSLTSGHSRYGIFGSQPDAVEAVFPILWL